MQIPTRFRAAKTRRQNKNMKNYGVKIGQERISIMKTAV